MKKEVCNDNKRTCKKSLNFEPVDAFLKIEWSALLPARRHLKRSIEEHLHAFFDEPELMHMMNQELLEFNIKAICALYQVPGIVHL